MSIGLTTTPLTTNPQAQKWFKFQLERAPSLTYFAQKVNIPKISFTAPVMTVPFGNIPLHGDHLIFEPLTVEFEVDSNLQNWLEIFNWMYALTEADGTAKVYKKLNNATGPSPFKKYSMVTVYSLDSQRNPTLAFKFENAFPVELSGIEFDLTGQDLSYAKATATFKYVRYTVDLP